MKKTFFIFGLLMVFFCCAQNTTIHAQTVASDWTKTDCDGNMHNLYSELNAGNVVVMDFAMMNCIPCAVATTAFAKLDQKFSVTHPGKLKHYGMGYIDSYSCTDLNSWKSQNNFTLPVMTKCAADVKFYGGMGMPTIVIVGGPNHKVFYNKQGFVQKDTAAIIKAIENAFASAAVASSNSSESLSVYPNPSANSASLQIDCLKDETRQIELYSANGVNMLSIFNGRLGTGKHTMNFSTKALASGKYYINVTTAGKTSVLPLTIIH